MRAPRALLLGLLLLTACSRAGEGDNAMVAAGGEGGAGARIEAAAVGQGLVVDPAAATLVGAWANDTDRACIVDGAGGRQRIGIVSDEGDGHGCSAAGTIERVGDRLRVVIGRCRFVADFDGEQISFPGALPAACDSVCRGRAALSGFTARRQSESASEAATLRGAGGRRLCE